MHIHVLDAREPCLLTHFRKLLTGVFGTVALMAPFRLGITPTSFD